MADEFAGEIVDATLSDAPLAERRAALGELLLDAFRADAFVSYVCDADGPFADPVAINMDAWTLAAYDQHYRFIDRLTPGLFAQRAATAISVPTATRDEFEGDFLLRSGMQHGMNVFASRPGVGSIDLRVWRSAKAGAFDDTDVRTLQRVGSLIERLWPNAQSAALATLTERERTIADLVARGLDDRAICQALDIALPTVRTHLRHAFEKTGVQNRARLAALAAGHHQN